MIQQLWSTAMTMHLEGPWLSMSGKRRGKVKFRNAEEARRARELDESWKELLKRQGVEAEQKRQTRAMKAPATGLQVKSTPCGSYQPPHHIPSRDTGGNATLAPAKVYTGTKVKGIATMHKSNAVPVFSDEEAVEISRMRRG
jgi:hypothetical protein